MRFAKGDTFDYLVEVEASVRNASGVLVPVLDFTGWTGSSEVRRTDGKLVATLEFTWIDAAQRKAKIRAASGTAAWPPCNAEINIKLTAPTGESRSTEPAKFVIWEPPTRA